MGYQETPQVGTRWVQETATNKVLVTVTSRLGGDVYLSQAEPIRCRYKLSLQEFKDRHFQPHPTSDVERRTMNRPLQLPSLSLRDRPGYLRNDDPLLTRRLPR